MSGTGTPAPASSGGCSVSGLLCTVKINVAVFSYFCGHSAALTKSDWICRVEVELVTSQFDSSLLPSHLTQTEVWLIGC